MSTEDPPSRRPDEIGFDWEAVIYRDFDVDLDQPGERSGAALDALPADLGVTAPGPEEGLCLGAWLSRLHAPRTRR